MTDTQRLQGGGSVPQPKTRPLIPPLAHLAALHLGHRHVHPEVCVHEQAQVALLPHDQPRLLRFLGRNQHPDLAAAALSPLLGGVKLEQHALACEGGSSRCGARGSRQLSPVRKRHEPGSGAPSACSPASQPFPGRSLGARWGGWRRGAKRGAAAIPCHACKECRTPRPTPQTQTKCRAGLPHLRTPGSRSPPPSLAAPLLAGPQRAGAKGPSAPVVDRSVAWHAGHWHLFLPPVLAQSVRRFPGRRRHRMLRTRCCSPGEAAQPGPRLRRRGQRWSVRWGLEAEGRSSSPRREAEQGSGARRVAVLLRAGLAGGGAAERERGGSSLAC